MAKLGASKPKTMSKLKDSKLLIIAIGVIGVVAFFMSLVLLRSFFQTEEYYVLNEDVGPRVQVTPEQLDANVVSEGQSPPNALTLEDVQSGGIFTQYPLRAGDILSESTVGALSDIRVGVPDEWVITSFGVGANDAAGGRITRGTHFDILAFNHGAEDPEARYLASDVLALDTMVAADSLSSADAVDTEEAQSGMTEQYVVGMRPEEAPLLHMAMDSYDIKLVLSPRQNEYNEPEYNRISSVFHLSDIDEEIPAIRQHGSTDNTFSPVERDPETGAPVEDEDTLEEEEGFIPDEGTGEFTPPTQEEDATEGEEPSGESPEGIDSGMMEEGQGNQ